VPGQACDIWPGAPRPQPGHGQSQAIGLRCFSSGPEQILGHGHGLVDRHPRDAHFGETDRTARSDRGLRIVDRHAAQRSCVVYSKGLLASTCPDSQAKIEVVHGDGRIMLEREFADAGSQKYDVIVLDAFRGASPPIHLMTAEAFDIYLKHLTPNGVLAVNIDLDTLDISPLHRGLAEKFGLEVHWFETPDEGDDCDSAVSWALYTKDPNFFTAPGVEPGISAWPDDGVTRLLWTDANANLFSVINWRNVLNLDDN